MSNVLYRKYRPQNFDDVIGQEHITKTLESAIRANAISHAYLFTGSRGTGKTSVARILAREIGTSENDLYEIDAASNRGIDDIRELREAVHTLPFDSARKVYIIDEAHMLTKEAFNALLKTLEEPPSHVVFILATTEMEKLPETIVSRCETHHFKKPNQAVLKKLAEDIAKKEGVSLENGAADLIALLGDGSFRDTQGILQKVFGARNGKTIRVEDVELVTGAPKAIFIGELTSAIAERNLEAALSVIQKVSVANIDMKTFFKILLERVRRVLLLRVAPRMRESIQHALSESDFAILDELARRKDSMITSALLLELLQAYDMTARAVIPELPLELALVSALAIKQK